MEEKNSFFFEGVPENSQFEVEEPRRKRKSSSNMDEDFKKALSGMTPDAIKSMFPESLLAKMEAEAAELGVSLEQTIADALKVLQDPAGMEKALASLFQNDFDSVSNGEIDNDDIDFPFAKARYLTPEMFGSIPCRVNPNLYGEFFEKFGNDPSKYFGEGGITSVTASNITADIAIKKIIGAKLVAYDDTALIFFVNPAEENKYGYFVSVYQKPDGEFAMLIPEFWNTFLADEFGNARLVDLVRDREYFTEDSNGTLVFNLYDEGSIAFATKFSLAPVHKVIISPVEFGVIKNLMPVINGDSNLLKVATIKCNNSKKAKELKIDGDFSDEQTTFDLYFNFGQQVSKESLFELSGILFKTNLNNCNLMRTTELHFVPGKYLYVNIDLGAF